jgi:phosphocarrier protein
MSITKNLTIKSSVGLHARPAAEFVKIAQEFDGEVVISYNGQEADGKSMIGILKLGIKKDTTFDLTLNGQKEEEYMFKFEELILKDD